MIRKTDAVVLLTRKYQESSLLTTLYTREYGRQNFIVKGYRSKRGRKKHSYFQPMSVIHTVFYYKESRGLQTVTESSLLHFFKRLQTEPVRIALGMLVAEIFAMSVKEEGERNDALFDLLKNVLIRLDEQEGRLIHVVIWYLLHLTLHLGFFPHNGVDDLEAPIVFDLKAGVLRNSPKRRASDHLFLAFMHSTLDSCSELRFTNEDKREMINTLLDYYRYHVEGFRNPGSLEVFAEIFS